MKYVICSAYEILKTMPTDKNIAAIYYRIHHKEQYTASISSWADTVVWSELHTSINFHLYWD
ncbi:MAG: hypothetical protein SPI74_04680 [Eubacterium sp.]|nr:hypothetical protein [Eubacterium sp.]